MNERYERCLQQGLEFQDYVMDVFWRKLGIPLMNFSSVLRQVKEGENVNGIEIKKDNRFRETGNLFIEVAEKSHPGQASYHAAGITKEDNTWLYAIGDEATIFVFGKNVLQLLYQTKKYQAVETPTSRGFLLPLATARKWACKVLEEETI